MIDNKVKLAAIYTYTINRGSGKSRYEAAQAAWTEVKSKYCKHLRAPHWDEQVGHNSGSKRSYECPLGKLLEVRTGRYGSHSAKWRRTKASREAMERVASEVLDYLDSFVDLGANGNFDYINEAIEVYDL